MADEPKYKTISKKNSGFPEYLHFDKLRREAIEYIGRLSGKIWTDHNVHDPGITILEVLIYALLDLGYRTNLPDVDLFSRNPEDKTKDNNFFTPSQILANNPLTITDFRKLLVDIEGVKNAWLEVADDLNADFCPPRDEPPIGSSPNDMVTGDEGERVVAEPCKCAFINGLYHVYVQLEQDYKLNIPEEKVKYDALINKIKCALMAHRNLCEDFIDITVLCQLDIGLCADIELEEDAKVEEVYLKIVQALREFFSPAPRFYTLQQLLDKQKPIEEIFAGRPYNLKESHGFVDTEEFEQIELKRELHLSDVYHVLFGVKGVKNVRNLGWIKCCGDDVVVNEWKLRLPKDHIPAFSAKCSGFSFTKFGMPVQADIKKLLPLTYTNLSNYGKVLYTLPSPNLDTEIPKGEYRKDLADYYSIQNEFPHVYGISEGGLADDVPNERKAQALQLQGFLLFFDQLLANYLTQLKNIRTLFALSSAGNKEDKHTYFINQVTNAPQLQKLLRFKTDGTSESMLGSEGSILAYPTSRKKLQELIDKGKLNNTDLERRCKDEDDFPGYTWCFAAERDQAVKQLQQDLIYGEYEAVIGSNYNDCYFFYYFTSSPDIALIGKRYYKNEQEARNAANSVKYAASFADNCRSFSIGASTSKPERFSFDIELNLDVYTKYLQLIVEDENLYTTRRQKFLDHLLARFAERFTDYALLSSGFLTPENLQQSLIEKEEQFLVHYDDISSNRGKAYDYRLNGWNNDNVSGFEKRFKALAGINNWQRHYLCNFVVEEAAGQYRLSFELFDKSFVVTNKVLDHPAALASLRSIYKKLGNEPVFGYRYVPHERKWKLFLTDEYGNEYVYPDLFPEEEQAATYSDRLQTLLTYRPRKSDILVSRFIYIVRFSSHSGVLIAESKTKFLDDNSAIDYSEKAGGRLKALLADANELINHHPEIKWGKLVPLPKEKFPSAFINEAAFEFKPIDVINLTSEKKKFSTLNVSAALQFDSLVHYDDTKHAKEGFRNLLVLLTSVENYSVERDKQEEVFKIFVSGTGEEKNKEAVYFESFDTEEAAENKINEIISGVYAHVYHLSISEPIPDLWEFTYRSASLPGSERIYQSKGAYKSEAEAWDAAREFYSGLADLHLEQVDNEWQLVLQKEDRKIEATAPVEPGEETTHTARQILEANQKAFSQVSRPPEDQWEDVPDFFRINENEKWVYKLVDKDNPVAYYPLPVTSRAATNSKKKELINRAGSGYNYIDIDLGSDVVIEITDTDSKVKWYHYQLRCTNRFYKNGAPPQKRLVLFESTKGYTSKEKALEAFKENYLVILKKARLEKNYGPGKFISFERITIHIDDPCYKSESIVYIPKETSDELNGYEVQRDIIPLVKSYPIRLITEGKYRFVLGRIDEANKCIAIDWCSKGVFKTPREAMQQFRFFLILLKHPGNYFIDWAEPGCRHPIYIREVLAISATGFALPEFAWGTYGIEKFICISQSRQGFHHHLNEHCHYSFYVACGNTGLIHPCTYETPKRRDTVLNDLYAASNVNFFDHINTDDQGNFILSNLDKEEIAKIFIPYDDYYYRERKCERLVEFFELVYCGENYDVDDGKPYLFKFVDVGNNEQEKRWIAEAIQANISIEEWKRQLLKMACFFPVKKDADPCDADNPESKKYLVEIKLPGFNSCEEDGAISDPSPCSGDDPECTITCEVAWKSHCCFNSCCQAFEFYIRSLILLGTYENYKSVYDCLCGSYRVELQPALTEEVIEKIRTAAEALFSKLGHICYQNNEYFTTSPAGECLNELVAVNPQAYTSPEMACEAAERAKRLINSEGMHLVEHILLRPRCKDEEGRYIECDECTALPKPCVDADDICHFPWKPGGDPDPCEVQKPVCFTPGCDPYSFISTVALPGWPERFRSPGNRQVIEKILQREAPAHVLLRILWLNPRDLCCFEFHFKRWNEWLAGKNCNPSYTHCNLLEFLFKKHFGPYNHECQECQPCPCPEQPTDSCFENEEEECSNFNLASTLNELFCWNKGTAGFSYGNCEPLYYGEEPEEFPEGDELLTESPVVVNVEQPEPPVTVTPAVPEVPESVDIPDAVLHEKNLRKQRRSSSYKENVKKIIEAKPENPVAEYTLRFLDNPNPDPKRYADLVHKILEDDPRGSEETNRLSPEDKQVLIENASWQYFDRIYFGDKEIHKIADQEPLFHHLRENKIDTSAIYNNWKGGDIKEVEPGTDPGEIEKFLI